MAMASCTVYTAGDADRGSVECPTCGCELLCLATSDKEDGEDRELSPTPPSKRKAEEKAEKDRKRPPRGLKRFKPGVTKVKEVRKAIRVEMLACIPGWNRLKARKVIDAHPTGTLGEIMQSSLGQLARIKVGQSATLGTSLAEALQFVVE